MWILAWLALAAQTDSIPLTPPQDETEAALHRALEAIRRSGAAPPGASAPVPAAPGTPIFAPPMLPTVPEIPPRPAAPRAAGSAEHPMRFPVPSLPTVVPWDPVTDPAIRRELEEQAVLEARQHLRALDIRRPPWEVTREFSEPDPRAGTAARINPPWSNPTLPSTLPPEQPYGVVARPEDALVLARRLDQAACRKFLDGQTVHRTEHGPIYEYRWADRTLALKRALRTLP